MYVGYMYQSNQIHGLTTNSTIKGILDTWYQKNLTRVSDKIDGNAGFCGDRQPSTSDTSINYQGGTGTTTTYYGRFVNLYRNKQLSFECSNISDLYATSGSEDGNGALTYPIGLISADEVSYAGGIFGTNNQSYYLYTGQNYWTISPFYFNGSAYEFAIYSNGTLGFNRADLSYGVRPVINLRADVTITGSGTSTDPYILS